MRSFILPAAFAVLAVGNPIPQEIDWDAVDALDPVPTPSIPIVDVAAQATTLAYSAAAAATSVAADILIDGLDKRDIEKRAYTYTSYPDTPEDFLADEAYADPSGSSFCPSGYTTAFQQLTASNTGFGYLGYTVLDSYDINSCAAKCDAIDGCASFNIYFERDPSVQPTSDNPNPPSVTNIKCVFWGGFVSTANAVNSGQYQEQFHVVIAGSNGCNNNTIAPAAGYVGPTYLGDAAIQAPVDCNGHDTYMGVQIWSTGAFDPTRCAAACTAASNYDRIHGIPTKAAPQTCQFFNTYLLLKNGIAVGQYCAMYNQTWAPSYATNSGQYRGTNHYTISHSYSYSNQTDAGVPTCS